MVKFCDDLDKTLKTFSVVRKNDNGYFVILITQKQIIRNFINNGIHPGES